MEHQGGEGDVAWAQWRRRSDDDDDEDDENRDVPTRHLRRGGADHDVADLRERLAEQEQLVAKLTQQMAQLQAHTHTRIILLIAPFW